MDLDPQVKLMAKGEPLYVGEGEFILKFVEDELKGGVKADGRQLVVFDADGTLWKGDITDEIFYDLLENRWLTVVGPLRDIIKKFAERYGIESGDDFYEDIKKIFVLFNEGVLFERGRNLLGLTKEEVTEEFYIWESRIFCGLHPTFIMGKAKQLAQSLPQLKVAEFFFSLFLILQKYNVKRAVISASMHYLVKSVLEVNNLKPDYVRGMMVKVKGRKLTSEIVPPITFKYGKVEALLQAFPNYNILFAFADNPEMTDKELLESANYGVIIRYN